MIAGALLALFVADAVAARYTSLYS
jgi:hypothetical protein